MSNGQRLSCAPARFDCQSSLARLLQARVRLQPRLHDSGRDQETILAKGQVDLYRFDDGRLHIVSHPPVRDRTGIHYVSVV